MSKRRNLWTTWQPEEDELLVKTVNEYNSQGKTKQEAFRDVSYAIGRTSGACNFHYQELVRSGKAELSKRLSPVEVINSGFAFGSLAFKLESLFDQLHQELQSLKAQLIEYQKMEQEYNAMKQDYETFLRILDRSRKQVMGVEETGRSFRMETNGNLIPVDKD